MNNYMRISNRNLDCRTPARSRCKAVTSVMVVCLGLSSLGAIAVEPIQVVQDEMKISPKDWPWWRGPARNGEANANQSPPSAWSETEHVQWRTAIPGRGYGSVCVFGDRLFLQTSIESTGAQLVLCFNRTTGEKTWESTVHAEGGMRKNAKSTSASSTPACDGKRVFVNFPNNGAMVTTALDLDGKELWRRKICDYVEHQGYGASPVLYGSLAIILADNKGGGALVGLDRQTGEIVWKRDRPQKPNYVTPIILNAMGKEQLIMTGCDKFSSLDPLTGNTNWEIDGATTECVTSTVTDGKHVYSSGGYPRNHMSAVVADGSGKIAWENDVRLYVPSLLIREGVLYGVLDAGIAVAWDSATGKELWRNRLGGTFSSSPVLVGDRIYATNEAGETFIYKALPTKFELISKSQLAAEVFATPVIVDSKILYRASVEENGKRQEYLYCLSN